ncbi:Hypothetical protein CINCED_3A015231 [Cinara cedri]|uniref:Uncharacterized protein n=1 Tax=Cinara cedri TaxID=506608 RepID=A0A5E4MC29_9HEMI|nr:Hypothetical protein CINCED_3A015231 [Cinara cedri]
MAYAITKETDGPPARRSICSLRWCHALLRGARQRGTIRDFDKYEKQKQLNM